MDDHDPSLRFIAQLNIARARFEFDDPRMSGFLALVDHVNTAAEQAAGFVWRLRDPTGNLNAGRDAREIVNLSVWRSIHDLQAFTWSGIHGKAMRKKDVWFETPSGPYLVLWNVGRDHTPSLEEGYRNLELLRTHGPSVDVFGWDMLRVS